MMDVKTYTAADINESRADCLSRLRQADVNGVDADRAIASMDEVKFVTHADYRALEKELAALRVRVGELVEAVRMEDNVRASIETSRIESASAALRTALAGCTEAKNEAVRSIA